MREEKYDHLEVAHSERSHASFGPSLDFSGSYRPGLGNVFNKAAFDPISLCFTALLFAVIKQPASKLQHCSPPSIPTLLYKTQFTIFPAQQMFFFLFFFSSLSPQDAVSHSHSLTRKPLSLHFDSRSVSSNFFLPKCY